VKALIIHVMIMINHLNGKENARISSHKGRDISTPHYYLIQPDLSYSKLCATRAVSKTPCAYAKCQSRFPKNRFIIQTRRLSSAYALTLGLGFLHSHHLLAFLLLMLPHTRLESHLEGRTKGWLSAGALCEC